MSEAPAIPADIAESLAIPQTHLAGVTIGQIFLAFLVIGATSFGGGVVAYLRSSLVAKHRWLNDESFVELLSISQSLPGLNATNMAILVGDRLRGTWGALVAVCGICLPGGLYMYAAGIMYHQHGERPLVTAILRGVVAAAVGLMLATILQLGRTSVKHAMDLVFALLTVIGVDRLHQSVPRVLIVVGILAILWYRPRKQSEEAATG